MRQTPSTPGARRWQRLLRLALAVVVVVSVLGIAGTAVAQDRAASQPSVVVAPHPNGSARLTSIYTYDLDTAAEHQAFQNLAGNATFQTELRTRFRARMAAIANQTTRLTNRSITVRDPQIETTTVGNGSVGVVELSVTFTNLVATRNGRLTVSEPFATGFNATRPLVVTIPDGYTVTASTPRPTTISDDKAVWTANKTLHGFNFVLKPATASTTITQTPTTATPSSPSAQSTTAKAAGIGVYALVPVGITLLFRTLRLGR